MGMVHYIKGPSRARLIAGDVPAWIANSPRRSYISAVVLSAPPWVDRKALMALHQEARRLSAETGVAHVLDHIVPLNHPRVCGLTVPWNLRVIPRAANGAKSNAWCEWHGDLFGEAQ